MFFNNIEQQSPEEIIQIIEKNTLENYSIYEINEAFMIALKKDPPWLFHKETEEKLNECLREQKKVNK